MLHIEVVTSTSECSSMASVGQELQRTKRTISMVKLPTAGGELAKTGQTSCINLTDKVYIVYKPRVHSW
jgi:hypothetical protein